MRQWNAFLAFIFAAILSPVVLATSPVGEWTTIDDKTGQKRAVVRINASGDTFRGTIIKTFAQPGDTGICTKCPGAFKDKSVNGLQFMWGLKEDGKDQWAHGQILDPKTGKIYRAKMTLKGNKLYVRGYIGVSMLGRTQVWVR